MPHDPRDPATAPTIAGATADDDARDARTVGELAGDYDADPSTPAVTDPFPVEPFTDDEGG